MRVQLCAENGMVVDGEAEVERSAPGRIVARVPGAEIEWLSHDSVADGGEIWVHCDELGDRWAAFSALGDQDAVPDESECVFWSLLGPGGALMETGTQGAHSGPGGFTPEHARAVSLAEFGSLIAWSVAQSKATGESSVTQGDPEFEAELARLASAGLLPWPQLYRERA